MSTAIGIDAEPLPQSGQDLVPLLPLPRDIRYRNYAVVVQQALSGGGVALGWETLLGGLPPSTQ